MGRTWVDERDEGRLRVPPVPETADPLVVRARRAVVARARDDADRDLLLDMLGLLPEREATA